MEINYLLVLPYYFFLFDFLIIITNYVFLKAYFFIMIKTRYKKEWIEIGRPNFFNAMENAEKVLSLLDVIGKDHPLRRKVWVYSQSFKLMNISLWLTAFLLILSKSLEFLLDVEVSF